MKFKVSKLSAAEMTAMALAAPARVFPSLATAFPSGALAPRSAMDRPGPKGKPAAPRRVIV